MIEQRRWSASMRRALAYSLGASLLVVAFALTRLDNAIELLVAVLGLALGVVGLVGAHRLALSTSGTWVRGTGLTGTVVVAITHAAVERWPFGLVGKADYVVLWQEDEPAFHVPLLLFSRKDQAEIRQTLTASGSRA